jgi:hypothetical protein
MYARDLPLWDECEKRRDILCLVVKPLHRSEGNSSTTTSFRRNVRTDSQYLFSSFAHYLFAVNVSVSLGRAGTILIDKDKDTVYHSVCDDKGRELVSSNISYRNHIVVGKKNWIINQRLL